MEYEQVRCSIIWFEVYVEYCKWCCLKSILGTTKLCKFDSLAKKSWRYWPKSGSSVIITTVDLKLQIELLRTIEKISWSNSQRRKIWYGITKIESIKIVGNPGREVKRTKENKILIQRQFKWDKFFKRKDKITVVRFESNHEYVNEKVEVNWNTTIKSKWWVFKNP